jgi:uncharacterized protein YndB with AHSA1/START domain
MELKTKVSAEDGKQEIIVTRDFDLPVELLFKAHVDPEILSQWMGTKVLKMEGKPHGSYLLETTDNNGKVLFRANGVIHTFLPNTRIIRTFEMENAPIGVQLEIQNFERLTDSTSRFTGRTIYETVAQRDQVLQYGMEKGVNMAHDRLQTVVNKLK